MSGPAHEATRRLPSERALAAQLGVGRRTLRRALEVLEAEGHIWRQQGKGTFLGPRPLRGEVSLVELSSRTNPLEVMEARLEIEPALARLAALRASNGDIDRLKHLAQKTEFMADGDCDSRELWDGAFHRAIAEAAGNSLLFAFVDVVDRITAGPHLASTCGNRRARRPASAATSPSIIGSLPPLRPATPAKPKQPCAIISRLFAPAFSGS